ncbi:MAG: tetratricopeptide repeat protein, partial [Spirochaetales bacterium]|nr:tetratricopeptide repeat protein [Spirochaetales bacterium]
MNKPTRIRNTFIVFLFLVAASVSAQQMSAREWNSRGMELRDSGNFYDAIDAYQQALQINPNYTAPLLGSAVCYFSLGEYEQALVFAERARSISPRTIDILIMEARIRVALGELEEAESLFRGVLSREPNNLQAKLGLAELQIAEGRVEQAATWYVKALQQAPHHERSLLSLYLIYSRAGRQDAAANYLQEALKYHPNSWQVQFYAAEHYGELGDEKSLQLALEHVHNAAILNEGNLEVSLLQADIFIRRSQMSSISDERRIGNLEKAVQTLREYLSRGEAESEQRALAYFSLGIALDRLGKVEESINHFQASL